MINIVKTRRLIFIMTLALTASLLLGGCPAGIDRGVGDPGRGSVKVAPQWKKLETRLAAQGFSKKELKSFFHSSKLVYSQKPMETKLRELYGIFYGSELTKALQEHLYQLGYDVRIDGRNGSGTKGAIKRYQSDHGMTANGHISESLLASMKKSLAKKKVRDLASYTPPPAPVSSRTSTYTQFTNPAALAKIKDYYKGDIATFNKMSKKYNVPGEVVASIMWIETRYGEYLGVNGAASMLASMAASGTDFGLVESAVSDLSSDAKSTAWLKETAAKRGDWAFKELVALMKYSYQNKLDPTSFPGSIYGAVGYGQFMPSNLMTHAVDGDGDGKADPFNKIDAIFSIGNYLKNHGWKNGQTESARRAVIMRYNKSAPYVNTVLYVADWLAKQ